MKLQLKCKFNFVLQTTVHLSQTQMGHFPLIKDGYEFSFTKLHNGI